MKSVREHLHDLHKRHAEHHAAVAGHFGKLAEHLAKTEHPAKATLGALAEEHSNMAEFHTGSMEACAKSIDDAMNKLAPLPEGLRFLTPNRPDITAVPRAGQPAPAPVKPNVPLEFEKVFAVADDDE